MSLLTVQRSPTPSDASEKSENVSVLEPPGEISANKSSNASASEDFIAVNGAAIALPSNCRRQSVQDPPTGLQPHMHRIFNKLRSDDYLKLVVKLEALSDLPTDYDRYFCLVSYIGRQGTEESVILGCDVTSTTTSIGLVIPVMLDMKVNLHGEGGFKVIVKRDHDYLFKPISVQALWATLQALSLALKVANDNNYFTNGLSHTWVNYYVSNINSTRLQVNEWRRTEESDEESRGFMAGSLPAEIDDRKRLEREIRTKLREVMLQEDLEMVTVSQLRHRLAEVMDIDLVPFKHFIGESVIFIFGQLESPSQIFDYVYLGSKWNACNLEELKQLGIGYIINITKEIDNFFPDIFNYYNVPLFDVEQADLMTYWEDTHRFINQARDNNSRVLVHCKMGMSRSASTVMAYAMKEFGWSFLDAHKYVKDRRSCVHPNEGFLAQLRTYEGILAAKSNRQKFNVPGAASTPGPEPGSVTTTRRSQQQPMPTEVDTREEDQRINIEEDIFRFKQTPLINDWKEFQSLSDSMGTSGDSVPPSNPSIAPDPMEEALAESGARGGDVIGDPRTRDMHSVREDLIIMKNFTEAPWRRSLRRKKDPDEACDEDRAMSEPGPSEIAICIDDGSGAVGLGSNGSFRPDGSWIRPDTDLAEPVLSLSGDIPGEETSTDVFVRPDSAEVPFDVCCSDDECDVVMRGRDSLPPSGTVKLQSGRIENRREAVPTPEPEVAAISASVAPTDSSLTVYSREAIQLEPGIVKKTRQSIEARQRTSGDFSGAHSPTAPRSAGESIAGNRFSGGGVSPVAPGPASSGSPVSAPSPPSPPPPLDPGLSPPQVHQKTLQLIRQIGFIRLHQRGAIDVLSVVREVESSVDREPIQPVCKLVEVFRGAC